MPNECRALVSSATGQSAAVPGPSRSSYFQILVSSALVGGSSAITLLVGIVRAKIMAVLLGPAGVGLVGLYGSVLDLTFSVVGLGLNSSGIRQIAEAAASGDETRVAATAVVLRKVSIAVGLFGAVVLLVASPMLSVWTFGSRGFTWGIAALGLALVFRCLSDGHGAVIQGTRRIGDLARIAAIAAVLGSTATIALVWGLGVDGIVPSIVIAAAITYVLTARCSRLAAPPSAATPGFRETAVPLLALGSAFMASSVLTTGAAYFIRASVRSHEGLAAAGLYQAAWTVGGLYVGVILQAMASDFYPRLTGVAANNAECNRLVNEQAHVGLLIGGPGVLATLVLAPLVLDVLYHGDFLGAVWPLRVICLGMALRVVAWPMGYIVLAKGARLAFVLLEIAAAVVHVGLALVLIPYAGVLGASAAFAGLYVWHAFAVYLVVRRLSEFRWAPSVVRSAGLFAAGVGVTMGTLVLLSPERAIVAGVLTTAVGCTYSLRLLRQLVDADGGGPGNARLMHARLHTAFRRNP